ncbi:Predicted pyrophosphatase or phosphodiesterase, AlkP superfamily [Pilibacter termitis]|uniref:Predicted pyrophosphatase or phosphodiesterase, AlkP superfamily n=1 Tax=Pilibacter termitis TaxID=263852 RepID=A0A1T4NK17_9ENTE|nr:ectonucleotide pyrophosphatase/phosphodiesterase [Pilibacter termitis]SJZ79589.1 Predicted pyrophosphatase or phosphodiesterase, AlkP superfamily [Pilibacter termitis]
MAKKLVIISIDALGASDLQGDLSHIPTLKQLVETGCHVEQVKAIYPSLTYPSHTTIVTGEYPVAHGIVNNTKIQPTRISPDWYWYRKDVKSKTIYDVARKEGKTSAAFLWPVTAKSKIHWNIAEIFPNRIWTNQVLVSMSASSPKFIFEMNKKYGYLRNGIQQPELDDFVTACAADTLLNKKPDLTLIHLVDMDSQRHAHGVRSFAAQNALVRQDIRVRKIIEATKKAGTYDETVFVILGDHYQIDVQKRIQLNVRFEQLGWLNARSDGTVAKNWEVYAQSCDGSSYVLVDKKSAITPEIVREELEKIEGIEAVYTTKQAEKMGASNKITFMVEAQRGYYFTDESTGEVVATVKSDEIGSPNRYKAVHGFSPEKENYNTTLVFNGVGIAKNKKIKQARLIDEAATFAKILALKTFPKDIAGGVIEGVFET